MLFLHIEFKRHFVIYYRGEYLGRYLPWAGTPPGKVHPSPWAGTLGQVLPGQVPPGQVTPWAGTPHPQAGITPREQCMLGDTGNKRAVRILLECILVYIVKQLISFQEDLLHPDRDCTSSVVTQQ